MARKGHRSHLRLATTALLTVTFVLPIIIWGLTLGFEGKPFGLSMSSSLMSTHKLAFIVAIFSVLLAGPPALLVRFAGQRTYRVISSTIFLPVCVGMLARNHAWIGMLSQKGFWSSLGWEALGGNSIIHTDIAVCLVMAFVFLPWSFFIAHISLGAIQPIHFEAAKTLGANAYSILLRILMPVWMRGAFISFFLVYCSTLGYFITPRMVGSNSGDLASTIIVKFVGLGDFRAASEIALVLLVSSMPFVILFLYLVNRKGGLFSWDI